MQVSCKITMPYIGSALSINHWYYERTRKNTKEDAKWMADLAEKAAEIPPTFRLYPVTVELRGTFKDRRSVPDLHNLHKVIGDALANGLGMDDVDFRFADKDHGISTDGSCWLTIKVIFGTEQ